MDPTNTSKSKTNNEKTWKSKPNYSFKLNKMTNLNLAVLLELNQ